MKGMKAQFTIKTTEVDWKPPFEKKEKTEECFAENGESFDRIQGNGNDEHVFRLIELTPNKVDLNYSKLFTVKESASAGNKTITLRLGEEKTLSYLWGEKGITKKIRLKDIRGEVTNVQTSNTR
jgi:hypothetical protein